MLLLWNIPALTTDTWCGWYLVANLPLLYLIDKSPFFPQLSVRRLLMALVHVGLLFSLLGVVVAMDHPAHSWLLWPPFFFTAAGTVGEFIDYQDRKQKEAVGVKKTA